MATDRFMHRLDLMEHMPEHQKMAQSTRKLLSRNIPCLALSTTWRPSPNTIVGVMRHTGKLQPSILQQIRDGWAFVTPLVPPSSEACQRPYYKGGCWVFQLPLTHWNRIKKKYPTETRG